MTLEQNPVLLYFRPARLVYVRLTGPYEQSVPRAWEKLCAWFHDNGVAIPQGRSYGIAHDNPADVGRQNCRYDACFAVTPETDDRALNDLAVTTLRGGAYVCRRIASGTDLSAAGRIFYAELEPPPGLAFDPNRPVLSVHNGNPMGREANNARGEICMPVVATDAFRPATEVA